MGRNHLWEAFFPFALTECRKQADLANLDADIAEGEALGNTGGDKSLRSAAPNALQHLFEHLFGASAAWRHHGGDARTPSFKAALALVKFPTSSMGFVPKVSSHRTPRWREVDSNSRSR